MNGSLPMRVAFTWSPKNIVSCDVSTQFFTHYIHIRKLNKCAKYIIYPECNLAGNIHFHGTLEIYDKIKWYKSVLPTFKRNGFVCIKSNPNDKWTMYIEKDKSTMEGVLNITLPITQETKQITINSYTDKLSVESKTIYDYCT